MNNTNIPQKQNEWNWQSRLVVAIVITIVTGIIALIILFVIMPLVRGNEVSKNGIETQAVSTGQIYQDSVRTSRSNRSIQYKAYYNYEVDGRSYEIIGQKDYFKNENISKGMKATVKYLADEPTKARVTKEE